MLRGKSYLDRHVYMIDGQIAVSELVRYDQLWPWMRRFAARMDRTLPTVLPMMKSTHRSDMRRAADILTAPQKARIQACADFEFRHFGFDP